MTTEGRQNKWALTATEDLSVATARYHAVSFAGLVVASTSRAAGILVTSAKSGERVSVVYEGVAKVAAGGAVSTLGYPLKITTSGWLVVAASGDAMVGRATATCASGDLVEAFVDFMTVPAWPGT
ncbi:MAG TPA: capsid cement protein [Steroidobacteraceae bacterium]